MFVNCPACRALVATDLATDQPPAQCPQCGQPMRSAQAGASAPQPAGAPPQPPAGPAFIALRPSRTTAGAPEHGAGLRPATLNASAVVRAHPAQGPSAAPDAYTPRIDAPTPGTAALPPMPDEVAPATPPLPPARPAHGQAGTDVAAAPPAARPTPRPPRIDVPPSPQASAPAPQATPPSADGPVQTPHAAAPGSPAPPALPPAASPAGATPRFAYHRARPAAASGQERRWLLAAAGVLALALPLQMLLADRVRLAADPGWRPWVQATCRVLRCDVPAWHAPGSFALLQRDVRPVPGQDGLLRVQASFRNDAAHAQAWPILSLTLSDLEGRALGMRHFRPDEYLAAPPPDDLIASGARAQVALEIIEPSPRAVAFHFDFH